jgi:hypothetical protein
MAKASIFTPFLPPPLKKSLGPSAAFMLLLLVTTAVCGCNKPLVLAEEEEFEFDSLVSSWFVIRRRNLESDGSGSRLTASIDFNMILSASSQAY